MKIRRARDEDYAGIARLRRQTIRAVNSKDYPADVIHSWSAEAGAQRFRESADTCKRWVALDKDRIIGFCEHSLECELTRMYVHPDRLRKGVGSRLLKVAEESLKKQGCQEISLESTLTAKDFYAKNGYQVHKKTLYKGNMNEPIYQMSKRLG